MVVVCDGGDVLVVVVFMGVVKAVMGISTVSGGICGGNRVRDVGGIGGGMNESFSTGGYQGVISRSLLCMLPNRTFDNNWSYAKGIRSVLRSLSSSAAPFLFTVPSILLFRFLEVMLSLYNSIVRPQRISSTYILLYQSVS